MAAAAAQQAAKKPQGGNTQKNTQTTSKKNDTITDIILKLRTDAELLAMTAELCKLTPEQRAAVQSVLSAFNSSK